jgi:hypothetical protein
VEENLLDIVKGPQPLKLRPSSLPCHAVPNRAMPNLASPSESGQPATRLPRCNARPRWSNSGSLRSRSPAPITRRPSAELAGAGHHHRAHSRLGAANTSGGVPPTLAKVTAGTPARRVGGRGRVDSEAEQRDHSDACRLAICLIDLGGHLQSRAPAGTSGVFELKQTRGDPQPDLVVRRRAS